MNEARDVQIPFSPASLSASVHGAGSRALILGHGAGGNRKNPFLVRFAEALASPERMVILYNFPYTERRGRIPDPPAVLEAAVARVGRYASEDLGARQVVHGGKSMGGRIASQAVAQGMPAEALVFLGYPLHPPGQTHKLRDAHLPSIQAPMLFVQGTRDAFARMDLLEEVLSRLPSSSRATLLKIEGGDHSFSVPKKAGRSKEEVLSGILSAVGDWLGERGL